MIIRNYEDEGEEIRELRRTAHMLYNTSRNVRHDSVSSDDTCEEEESDEDGNYRTNSRRIPVSRSNSIIYRKDSDVHRTNSDVNRTSTSKIANNMNRVKAKNRKVKSFADSSSDASSTSSEDDNLFEFLPPSPEKPKNAKNEERRSKKEDGVVLYLRDISHINFSSLTVDDVKDKNRSSSSLHVRNSLGESIDSSIFSHSLRHDRRPIIRTGPSHDSIDFPRQLAARMPSRAAASFLRVDTIWEEHSIGSFSHRERLAPNLIGNPLASTSSIFLS